MGGLRLLALSVCFAAIPGCGTLPDKLQPDSVSPGGGPDKPAESHPRPERPPTPTPPVRPDKREVGHEMLITRLEKAKADYEQSTPHPDPQRIRQFNERIGECKANIARCQVP